MPPEAPVYVGLGSNLGDREGQLAFALVEINRIAQTRVLRTSPWYRSRAIGPGAQGDYINGVAELLTRLSPLRLLDALQAIEAAAGRVRRERWGPRTLDIDILLYGKRVLRHPRLALPHPALAQRNFVVAPLADLAPGLVLPDGERIALLRDRLGEDGLERLDLLLDARRACP